MFIFRLLYSLKVISGKIISLTVTNTTLSNAEDLTAVVAEASLPLCQPPGCPLHVTSDLCAGGLDLSEGFPSFSLCFFCCLFWEKVFFSHLFIIILIIAIFISLLVACHFLSFCSNCSSAHINTFISAVKL